MGVLSKIPSSFLKIVLCIGIALLFMNIMLLLILDKSSAEFVVTTMSLVLNVLVIIGCIITIKAKRKK